MIKERYTKFINSRRNRVLTEYTEIHHIIPRCLGGLDDSDNLIPLTAREHFIAHWMLWRLYTDNQQLASAFLMMCVSSSTNKRENAIPSKLYEKLKKQMGEHNSKLGKLRSWYNDGKREYHVYEHQVNPEWITGRLIGSLDTCLIDVYDKDKNLVFSANNTREALYFLAKYNSLPKNKSRLIAACENAKVGKACRVEKFWICYNSDEPVYKTQTTRCRDNLVKAINSNKGKTRPEHSQFMKDYKRDKSPIYGIPEGEFRLEDAVNYYGRDMLISWCKNNEVVITKMMILKSKCLSMETHSRWIGKTRKEIGFYYARSNKVDK